MLGMRLGALHPIGFSGPGEVRLIVYVNWKYWQGVGAVLLEKNERFAKAWHNPKISASRHKLAPAKLPNDFAYIQRS